MFERRTSGSGHTPFSWPAGACFVLYHGHPQNQKRKKIRTNRCRPSMHVTSSNNHQDQRVQPRMACSFSFLFCVRVLVHAARTLRTHNLVLINRGTRPLPTCPQQCFIFGVEASIPFTTAVQGLTVKALFGYTNRGGIGGIDPSSISVCLGNFGLKWCNVY
jgi:hypothetical protein